MTERKPLSLIAFCALALIPVTAAAQQIDVSSGSAAETVSKLKPGQYVWAPQIAPAGPMLLIVNVRSQRAVLYRNGIPIGATTVSTGRPGYETPTGVFTILQKRVEHYSSKYDNAPMPYMERLTWRGVALHAGQLPGRPASHGCIRLPREFARLLYKATNLGMTVVVTDRATTPRLADAPDIAPNPASGADDGSGVDWNPQKSPSGPVSIIVSSADRRAVVFRNGIAIGSAPVTVEGTVAGSWAYALRSIDQSGQQWIRLSLSGADDGPPVTREEWQRFQAPEQFRRNVAAIVQPGTKIIVTPDSLISTGSGTGLRVMESESVSH